MSYNNSQKKCGFCGETIPAGAGRCPYCGSILEVTFDNGYGGDQINQPADPGAKPFPGDDSGMNNEQEAGTVNTPDNNDASGNRQDPGSAWTPEQPQQSLPSSAPSQYQQGQEGQGNWQISERPAAQDYQRPYYQNSPQQPPRYQKPALSNGLKVFLTVLFTMLPGIGQLAGIITAIVFMNAEGDSDRRSFGVALLVACLIMFVLACIGCFTVSIVSSQMTRNLYNY